MLRDSSPARATTIFLAAGLAACGPGALAENLAKAPEFNPTGQAKCGVAKSQAEPLIVEWPDAARGKLESQVRRGVVAVRYVGCDMEVLARCTVPGKYGYASLNPKKSHVKMRNADELYASIPAYAVKFEGTLARAGELNVEMTIVGRYESDRSSVRVEDLQGDCDGATHVVTGLSVGAFEFFAGADAHVGAGVSASDVGVNAKSTSSRETLNADGQEEACKKAAAADSIPPYGCGALLGLEVQPIVGARPAVAPVEIASAPAPSPPVSPGGRFRVEPSGGSLRDTSTGFSWTRTPRSGDHREAQRGCTELTLARDDRDRAPARDRSLFAQDAAPSVGTGWRLPSEDELKGFLAAASTQGLVSVDAADCFWTFDSDDASLAAARPFLGQGVPPSTCVTRSGGRKSTSGEASFLCVKRR